MGYRNQTQKLQQKTIIKIVVFVSVVGTSSVFAYHKYSEFRTRDNSGTASALEAQLLADEIGRYMFLPLNEIPTVATVSDKRKLANQPIFKDAENGDKLLAYKDAKRLILYRPTKQLIVTIASIYDEGENN